MAMDSDGIPCTLKMEKPEEENVEAENETEMEKPEKENVETENETEMEKPEEENLETETETDAAEVENHTKEQATCEVEIKQELLEQRENTEADDARWKSGNEMELEPSSELEEGELADEDEESEKVLEELKEEKDELAEVEVEVNKLDDREEVEKRAVEEEDRWREEEVSNFHIKQEEIDENQEHEVPFVPVEVKTDEERNPELVAFKAHRWLDENYNGGSDSSSVGDEPNEKLKVEFGDNSDSETERPLTAANKQQKQKKQTPKTRGEFSLEDLPPIEKLQITVGDDVELVEVGAVLHSVGVLVVVESKPNLPPLDADTILFLEGRKVLGKIFDTIGRVVRPCYTVRFNSASEIEEQGVRDGMTVFYAPLSKEWTNYVFMAHIMKMHGSDASWEHDNEPPPQFVDYSDDEAEQRARAKTRGKPEEGAPAVTNESRGKHRKQNHKQQSRGFGNSTNANRGRGNTTQTGDDRTVLFSSTEWSTNQPLTSWPPKQQISRPRGLGIRHRWARPPAQQASVVQFTGLPPPIIPFPDLNQPPPLSLPARPLPQFGLPPSHIHGLPPTQVPLSQSQVTPLFQMRPQSFPQGSPGSPWRSFQNAPPYSFTTPPPAPYPVPLYSSQPPPSQNGPLRPTFGSPPQPLAPLAQFGPPSFFRYQGPTQH